MLPSSVVVVGALYQRDDLDQREPLARVQVIERQGDADEYTVIDRWDDAHQLSHAELVERYRRVSEALPAYPRFRALRGGE